MDNKYISALCVAGVLFLDPLSSFLDFPAPVVMALEGGVAGYVVPMLMGGGKREGGSGFLGGFIPSAGEFAPYLALMGAAGGLAAGLLVPGQPVARALVGGGVFLAAPMLMMK